MCLCVRASVLWFRHKLTILPPPSLSLSFSLSRPPVPWLLRSSWASWMAWVTTSPSPRKPEDKTRGQGGEQKWAIRWWWRKRKAASGSQHRHYKHFSLTHRWLVSYSSEESKNAINQLMVEKRHFFLQTNKQDPSFILTTVHVCCSLLWLL